MYSATSASCLEVEEGFGLKNLPDLFVAQTIDVIHNHQNATRLVFEQSNNFVLLLQNVLIFYIVQIIFELFLR